MTPTLSTLSIILGLGIALPHAYGVVNPAGFSAALRKFPRSLPWGFALVLLGTAWFVRNLSQESISDFESLKPALYAVFLLVGIGTCIYVQDFLAVRGLAIVMLLVAKLVLDTARWNDSPWSLVIKIWAYAWVLAGIWFTISPWRLRDLLNWSVADVKRTRILSAVRVAFGLFVFFLGLKAF
jgi:hypothetical protein